MTVAIKIKHRGSFSLFYNNNNKPGNKGDVKKELENGYRRFDPQRGMDYVLDIILYTASSPFTIENLARTKTVEISHRMQVLKPLSHVEIVPMPYSVLKKY